MGIVVMQPNMDQEPNRQHIIYIDNADGKASQRVSSFATDLIGISGTTIMAGVSAYKDIRTGLDALTLFRTAGFLLLSTFIFAAMLMMSEMLCKPGEAQPNYINLYRAVLVAATGVLLMATDTVFVVLVSNGSAVFTILLYPIILMVSMIASPQWPAGAARDPAGSTAHGEAQDPAGSTGHGEAQDPAGSTGREEAQDLARNRRHEEAQDAARSTEHGGGQGSARNKRYEEAMENGSKLASFGAKAAFATHAIIILGYLKNKSFGSCHPQVDLAMSFFAALVSTVAMMVATLPGNLVKVSFQARLVEVTKLLKSAMLSSLASVAVVLAVEFVELKFILSFLPEVVIGILYIVIERLGADDPPPGSQTGPERREPDFMAKAIATLCFALMAGIYAMYPGADRKHDVYLKACILVILAAIISSLRQMALLFNFPVRGGLTVVVAATSIMIPGLAVVIVMILLVKIFLHLYRAP